MDSLSSKWVTERNKIEFHDKWNRFVVSHPAATFFHQFEWREVLLRQGLKPFYLLALDDGGEIKGVLPLAHVKSWFFGNHLVSTPFCVYAGPLAETPNALQMLLEESKRLSIDLGVDDIEYRNMSPLAGEFQSKDMYVTFRKTLSSDEDKNLMEIPRKQRAMVRKGIKAGLRSEVVNSVEEFYQVYSTSVRNLGTPVFSKSYFESLLEIFKGHVEISLIRNPQGLTVAAVLSFYFRDEVLPYYAGSIPLGRSLKANDFMYWDLMCRATTRGARLFDFGRSKKGTGSFNFKKNWGFKPETLAYQYVLGKAIEIPQINPNNPKYAHLISAWKRLPLPMANLVGPYLSKYLS